MSETGIELGVDGVLNAVMARLAAESRVWVTGDVGSGRTTLGEKLVAELGVLKQRAVFVQFAEREEPDAAISGFYGLARDFPTGAKRRECWQDWPHFADAVQALVASSDEGDGWTWILNVPASWEAGKIKSDWDVLALRRCHDLLRSLSQSKLRIVWLTGHMMSPATLGMDDTRPISLPRPRNATALFSSEDWENYGFAAERLAAETSVESQASPVVLRLAVGVVHFGGDAKKIAETLGTSAAARVIRPLCEELIDRIKRQRGDLMGPIRRLLHARTSVDADAIERITSVPEEHRPLLTHCIGYGSGQVRVSTSVRAHLWERIGVDSDSEDAHHRLTEYYKSIDGVSRIADTHGGATTAWLEKTYHQLQLRESPDLDVLPCREMYWTRGRYLSQKLRDYGEAARVYERCAALFSEDDYARHYWAFNLARAGRDRETVEAQYRQAIQLFPEHPWWNSRLVTFLIEQGRPRSAQGAWTEALENVDPDGDRLITDPELADQLHFWVAQAWLEAGNSAEAMAILRSIPDDAIRRSPRLPGLRQRVLASAEAEALGFAVYPEGVPMEERWSEPRVIAVEPGRKWWPGSVLSAGKESVRIGYGENTESGLASFALDVDGKTWREQTGVAPEKAAGFVELAEDVNGPIRLRVVAARPSPREDYPEAFSSFPYLDRWRSQTPTA